MECDHCKKKFIHPRKNRFCSRSCRTSFSRDKCKESYYSRISESPEAYLSYRFNEIKTSSSASSKRRRKSLPVEFSITKQEVVGLWSKQAGKCALTGMDMKFGRRMGYQPLAASVDRIDNSLGYVSGNIRLVCRVVNQMRFNMSDQELADWCHKILGNWIHKNTGLAYELGYLLHR